jgi:hypothetical protein
MLTRCFFLSMLCCRQLESNVLLTSIFSKLGCCPNRLIHTFLLTPQVKPAPGARLLLTTLQGVWKKAQRLGARMPNFPQRLAATRERLMLSADSSDEKGRAGDRDSLGISLDVLDERKVLEGIVVLGEFVKELECICRVKAAIQNIGRQYQAKFQDNAWDV